MDVLLDRIDRLAEHWIDRKVNIRPGIPGHQLEEIFRELGCQVSTDVRLLYETVGGFQDGESEDSWSFWSISKIRKWNGLGGGGFVLFADFLASLHMYAFRYETPATSSVHISYEGQTLDGGQLAPSVSDFLEILLTDSDRARDTDRASPGLSKRPWFRWR